MYSFSNKVTCLRKKGLSSGICKHICLSSGACWDLWRQISTLLVFPTFFWSFVRSRLIIWKQDHETTTLFIHWKIEQYLVEDLCLVLANWLGCLWYREPLNLLLVICNSGQCQVSTDLTPVCSSLVSVSGLQHSTSQTSSSPVDILTWVLTSRHPPCGRNIGKYLHIFYIFWQFFCNFQHELELALDSTMSQSWIEFLNWILNFNIKQFVLVI